jgi:hypothetical protein
VGLGPTGTGRNLGLVQRTALKDACGGGEGRSGGGTRWSLSHRPDVGAGAADGHHDMEPMADKPLNMRTVGWAPGAWSQGKWVFAWWVLSHHARVGAASVRLARLAATAAHTTWSPWPTMRTVGWGTLCAWSQGKRPRGVFAWRVRRRSEAGGRGEAACMRLAGLAATVAHVTAYATR